jgi:hypothetical protein
MTALAERTRDLALTAERAAVDRQHAGLATGRDGADPAVVGALQLAADSLWAATRALGLPQALNRRPERWAVVTTALSVVLGAAALLLVPHPTRPWVLAVVVAGCSLAGQLLWRAGRAVRDRRTPPAPARPLAEMLTELRAGMAAVAADLEPADSEAHRTAGRRLELAHVWLDDAEVEADAVG